MKQHSALTLILAIAAGFAIRSLGDTLTWWRVLIVAVIVGVFLERFFREAR